MIFPQFMQRLAGEGTVQNNILSLGPVAELPGLANLQPGQKIAWGMSSMISYRDKLVVTTSRDKVPRDLVLFPAGSKILLNTRGQAAFVVMPSTGEPRAVTR